MRERERERERENDDRGGEREADRESETARERGECGGEIKSPVGGGERERKREVMEKETWRQKRGRETQSPPSP